MAHTLILDTHVYRDAQGAFLKEEAYYITVVDENGDALLSMDVVDYGSAPTLETANDLKVLAQSYGFSLLSYHLDVAVVARRRNRRTRAIVEDVVIKAPVEDLRVAA